MKRLGAGREHGTVLIETALVLPMLLLVCVGIFEFGRAFQTWQVLTNASREGARIAVLPGKTDTMVTDRVRTYLQAGQLEYALTANVVIDRATTVSTGPGTTAPASAVTVEYPFSFMVLQPVASLINPNTTAGTAFTMTAVTTMRTE